jgi:hypothetical protein
MTESRANDHRALRAKYKVETVAMRRARSRQESRTFSTFPVSKGVDSRVGGMVGGVDEPRNINPEPLRLPVGRWPDRRFSAFSFLFVSLYVFILIGYHIGNR